MRTVIVIESATPLSRETWKRLLSRVDFALEREIDIPSIHARLDVKEDKKCPRREPGRSIEDCI